MAASPVRKRYISAVYDDKYFPQRNAAVPFRWETTPGRLKRRDDEQVSGSHDGSQDDGAVTTKKASSETDACIYPLPPPPKLCPLRVKDLLLQRGNGLPRSCLHCRGNDHHHDRCPLRALPSHRLPWLIFARFPPIKASTVVPFHKSAHCMLEPPPQPHQCSLRKCQASPRWLPLPNRAAAAASSQGRSHSFRHAPRSASRGCSASGPISASAGPPLISERAPGRRCSSFNSLSAPHHTILEDDEDDDGRSAHVAAAAALWAAGACILAAAAADGHHHLHGGDPCKVASKLKDLMQQSANFSELGLPLPLAMRCHSTLSSTKKRTKSMESEAAEAFPKEGSQNLGLPDSCEAEDDELAQKTTSPAFHSPEPKPSLDKLIKKKGFFAVFKSDCIACWCPSS